MTTDLCVAEKLSRNRQPASRPSTISALPSVKRRDCRPDRSERLRRQDRATLVNLLTRRGQAISSGRIRFEGEDVTAQRPFERAARRGLARTFQIVQPFPRMTVLENVAAGALFGGAQPSVADAMAVAREQLEFMWNWRRLPIGRLRR